MASTSSDPTPPLRIADPMLGRAIPRPLLHLAQSRITALKAKLNEKTREKQRLCFPFVNTLPLLAPLALWAEPCETRARDPHTWACPSMPPSFPAVTCPFVHCTSVSPWLLVLSRWRPLPGTCACCCPPGPGSLRQTL